MADDPGSSPRRTWPERLAIVGAFASAVVCFLVAAALIAGYVVVRQRNIVDLQDPAEIAAAAGPDPAPATIPPETTGSTTAAGPSDSGATTSPPTAVADDSRPPTTTAGPLTTFPDADPEAQNFLITGADNGACIDPDSPYAGAFGDREGMGERSDTIMVLRVDPDADRVAVLSFPRDLYIDIGGSKSRINSAYRRDDPQRLIDAIFENFGVPIDHYLQVDFCAFKTLVDAVGGVAVPFEFPARDENTGLNVPTTGCFVFDGEHALAYVRSRHYDFEDPPGSGNWQEDPASDLGRVSRQQDFIRRTLSSVLDEGPLNPRVARGLIRAATEYVVTDRNLTAARMLEFAGVMNDVDPASILTYQIESTPAKRQRRVGARPQHGRREHAGDPRHVPWRDVAGRCSHAGLRRDDDRHPARVDHHRRCADRVELGGHRADDHRHRDRPADRGHHRGQLGASRRPAGEPGRHRPAVGRHVLTAVATDRSERRAGSCRRACRRSRR